MSLKNDLSELDGIKQEIQKLSLTLKTLRDKKNSIEKHIIEYLKNKDIKGLKFNNNIISLEKKEHRVRKKKIEKQKEISTLLQSNGIHISDKILLELNNIQKGNPKDKHVLKISSSSFI
jgi:hypothetical protein